MPIHDQKGTIYEGNTKDYFEAREKKITIEFYAKHVDLTVGNSPDKKEVVSPQTFRGSVLGGRLTSDKKKSVQKAARKEGQAVNHMDILKKFRYNFHYWLRNCYQIPDMDQS